MKKLLIFTLIALFALSAFSCNTQPPKPSETTDEITTEEETTGEIPSDLLYGLRNEITISYPIYQTVGELLAQADLVYVGKVTDISFEVLDSASKTPVNNGTPSERRELYTVYSIDILETYRGEAVASTKMCVYGANEETDPKLFRELQELLYIKNAHNKELGLPIVTGQFATGQSNKAICEIGEYYLFVLEESEGGYPTVLNLQQSVFQTRKPSAKQTLDYQLNTVYYSDSGTHDKNGNPMISPKDVISAFGEEKWSYFIHRLFIDEIFLPLCDPTYQPTDIDASELPMPREALEERLEAGNQQYGSFYGLYIFLDCNNQCVVANTYRLDYRVETIHYDVFPMPDTPPSPEAFLSLEEGSSLIEAMKLLGPLYDGRTSGPRSLLGIANDGTVYRIYFGYNKEGIPVVHDVGQFELDK